MARFFLLRFVETAAVVLVTMFSACRSEAPKNQNETSPFTDSLTTPIYPFTQYLQEQLAWLDSTPLAVTRIVSIDMKIQDSAYTEKSTLREVIGRFYAIDPNKVEHRPFFREESFKDLSTESLVFDIEATNKNLPLRSAQVLLRTDNQRVKRVMAEHQANNADSSVTARLLWVHNKRCQVAEQIEFSDGRTYKRVTQFVWDTED